MFKKKDLIFPMPEDKDSGYLSEVLEYENTFLKYLEGETQPVNAAYATYAARIKNGASPEEIEGMAQVINYIESLPSSEKETFLQTIRETLESAFRKAETEIDETVFIYSDGTTQTVDVVGTLSVHSYKTPEGANLIKVVIGRHVTEITEDCHKTFFKAFGGAFEDCALLTSVIIPDSVKKIGCGTFSDCSSLVSVVLPNAITEIAPYTFYHCLSLSSTIIPDSVTKIGTDAFSGCMSLADIIIPDNVQEIELGAFFHCDSLSSIVIPNGIKVITQSLLATCTALSSVTLPNSIEKIEECAFWGCISLSAINIPYSVKIIEDSAFAECKKLESIDVPSEVETIDNDAFSTVPHIQYTGKATWKAHNKWWGAKALN